MARVRERVMSFRMKKRIFTLFLFLVLAAALFPLHADALCVSGRDWHIVGTGDFKGDAVREVLWSNRTTKELVVWHLIGGGLPSEQVVNVLPDLAWSIIGLADFDGDGKPDLLVKNELTGAVVILYLRDWAVRGQEAVAAAGGPWNVMGVGDFNRDGHPDIFWRNSATGESVVWFMNGATRLDQHSLAGLPPPWSVVAIGDFDRDGFPDILWENPAGGDVVVWYMKGLTRRETEELAARAPPRDIPGFCSLDGDDERTVILQYIAILHTFRPRLIPGLPSSFTFSGPGIRAPPVSPMYS